MKFLMGASLLALLTIPAIVLLRETAGYGALRNTIVVAIDELVAISYTS